MNTPVELERLLALEKKGVSRRTVNSLVLRGKMVLMWRDNHVPHAKE